MTESSSLVRSTSRKLKTMFSSSSKPSGDSSSSSSSDAESSSIASCSSCCSSTSTRSSRTSSIRRKSHRTKMPEPDLSIRASTFSWTWNWDDDSSADEDFAPVFPHFPSTRPSPPPMLVTVEVSPRTSLDTASRLRADWTLLPNRALDSQDFDSFNNSYLSDDDDVDEEVSYERYPSRQSVLSNPIPRIIITTPPPPPPEPKMVRKPNKIRRKPPPSFIVEPVILVNPCTM